MRRGRVMMATLYPGPREMRDKSPYIKKNNTYGEPDNERIMYVELENQLRISGYLIMYLVFRIYLWMFLVGNHVHTKQTCLSFFALSFPRGVPSSKRGRG